MKQLLTLFSLLLLLTIGCKKDAGESLISQDEKLSPAYYENQARQMLTEDDYDWSEGINKVQGPSVYIPAGSVDVLQAAIDNASPHTTIYLRSGLHIENQTVLVNKKIRLKGLGNAVLKFDTDTTLKEIFVVDPGLHIKNTSGVIIENLTLGDINDLGCTALLIENSDKVRIRHNRIEFHQYTVIVQYANKLRFHDNNIVCDIDDAWWGYVHLNGNKARIYNNRMSNCGGNFFLTDERGLFMNNEILNVPAPYWTPPFGALFCTANINGEYAILPDGTHAAADHSAGKWLALGNHIEQATRGIVVQDNANHNILVNNNSVNNAAYDIYLGGDVFDSGGNLILPTSYDNIVLSMAHPSTVIKNCGQNNTVLGGNQVDLTLDPCN